MAFDEYQAERIRQAIKETGNHFTEKSMMGGRLFMMDDKMLCGTHIDKKLGQSLLMARIGEDAYPEAIKIEDTLPMDFTGRPMRGYIFVTPDGIDLDSQLAYWIELCIQHNPFSKASVKKKRKN
ncbi:MAG: hypothetical protein ACI9N1_000225 [Flavobacteriales bacterium]|jgi:hypothetical protein